MSSPTASFVGLCILISMLGGCKQPSLPNAAEQFARGAELYQVHCAACHEIERGIGPRLTADVLATRMSAQSLFTYNRLNMPYEAGNTLSQQQYWDITAYMLVQNGLLEKEIHLGENNAASFSLQSTLN